MKKKLSKLWILLAMTTICFSLVATPAFAADPSVPIINGATDGGHASGCQHNHSSGCYSYGSHSYPSCYGGHSIYTKYNNTLTHCGKSYNIYGYACKYCAAGYSTTSGCVVCGHGSGTSGSAPTGTCSSNLTCTSSHSYLSCSKGSYYNCVKPTLTSVSGPAGWVKEAYTPVLNGSNIAQVQIDSGAWTTPAACQISESGTYPIRVKSSSGHIMSYMLTVGNIDNVRPETPEYSLTALFKGLLEGGSEK